MQSDANKIKTGDKILVPFEVLDAQDTGDYPYFLGYGTARIHASAEMLERFRQATDTIEALSEKLQPANTDSGWIPCEERMPEERDSFLAKWHGTDRWNAETMWRKQSDDVLVTMEFEDGSRKTEKMKTHDGKWFYDIYVVKFKVIAWRPLPEPYREVRE